MGDKVGNSVGARVGDCVGALVGALVGDEVGVRVGDWVGTKVGAFDVGALVGNSVPMRTRSIETFAVEGVVLVTIEFTMMRNVLAEPLKFGIM